MKGLSKVSLRNITGIIKTRSMIRSMSGAWSTHDEEECVQGLMGKTGGMRQLENPRCKAGLIWFRVEAKWRGTCTHGKEP